MPSLASKTSEILLRASSSLSGARSAPCWYWWLDRAIPSAERSLHSLHLGRRGSISRVFSLFVSSFAGSAPVPFPRISRAPSMMSRLSSSSSSSASSSAFLASRAAMSAWVAGDLPRVRAGLLGRSSDIGGSSLSSSRFHL